MDAGIGGMRIGIVQVDEATYIFQSNKFLQPFWQTYTDVPLNRKTRQSDLHEQTIHVSYTKKTRPEMCFATILVLVFHLKSFPHFDDFQKQIHTSLHVIGTH